MKHFYLLFFCTFFLVPAQKKDSVTSDLAFSVQGQYGKLIPTNIYIKGLESRYFAGLSFEVTKQTDGDKMWQQKFGNPSYGAGVYMPDFLENKEFGHPVVVYGIFRGAIKKWKKVEWQYEWGGGFAFNWKPFSVADNYLNPSLGSSTSIYINVGTRLQYQIGKHFDLALGANFNHFSNGALKMPNKGLNVFSPKLSLTYNLDERNPAKTDSVHSRYDKYGTWEIAAFGGVKNVMYKGYDVDLAKRYEGFYFPAYGVETVYHRQISFKSAFGLGIGIHYDGEYNYSIHAENGELYKKKNFKNEKLLLNIFPSYRLMIGDFSVNVQPGFYLFKQKNESDIPWFYQRLGFQYQLSKKLFVSVGIRAYDFHVADFIEWKLGYAIGRKKIN
jgi:hypothetical protein